MDGTKCHCLENFWDFYLAEPSQNLYVDMSEVEEIDPIAVATMVTLLRRHVDAGASVLLESPPQMLAHTLYKTGMLESGNRIRIDSPRTEEPYAG
ncbi:MAG: STAS domain-containing protein [Planctomycetota bacterium]